MEEVGELRYTKIERIGLGEGMNSEVYRGYDPQIGGEVAVKEIPKESFGNKIAEYFEEAKRMFAVTHRHVVRVRFGCTTAERVVLAMPYYPNGSLMKRIRTNPLSLNTCLDMAQKVLSGLGQIHIKKFLHLDVRPPNILFDSNWEPSVADFGQSRSIDATGIVTAPETYHRAMPPGDTKQRRRNSSVGHLPSRGPSVSSSKR
jgi:serine/threonine protein kinase